MEHFFKIFKTEWMPTVGYQSLTQSNAAVVNYITGYYSKVRPHQHNDDLTQNESEQRYWNSYKPVFTTIYVICSLSYFTSMNLVYSINEASKTIELKNILKDSLLVKV